MQRRDRWHLPVGVVGALWCIAMASALGDPQQGRIPVLGDMTTRNVRSEESNLANLIADALRASDKEEDRADIAFMPASAFAEVTIPKGTASVDDILKALVFRDDIVVIVKLTGAQVKRALEHGLAIYPQKNSAFLQVSGLTATIDPSREKDSRVVAVKVGRNPLDENKTYTVAMPSPLANGGLVFSKVWDRSAKDHDTDRTVEQAVVAYLSKQSTLGGKSEERLVFKK